MGLFKVILAAFSLSMLVCAASEDASTDESAKGGAVVSEETATTEKPLEDCYDFVVVGAGSAGSVVANRLSANGTYSVLLLEAGGEETLDLQVPFMAPFLSNANNSWEYYTLPQRNACFSYPYNVSRMTQGKILGGTSSINSMSFVRGNRKDFDSWETDFNASGWNYDNVLPYFKGIEMFNISGFDEQEVEKYHGKTGETPVNYPNYFTPLSYVFLNACKEAGYEYIDYNGAKQLGSSRVQSNTAGGARMSANTCFLQRGKENRTNLRISIYSEANKIHFVEENGKKRATAVEFTVNGTRKNVSIGYEVIVCAGAIGSPKLLMLSGIGPEEQLRSLNISVIANLPVGQGLQDHVVFLGLVVTTTMDLLHLADLANNKSLEQYRYNQSGLLALPGAYEAFVFSRSDGKKSEDEHPDIQMALTALFPDPSINKSGYIPQDIYDEYYAPMFNKTGFMTTLTLVQPNSRGYVMLNHTNINGSPYIDPNMLSQEDDINRTVKGIQNMKSVFETEAMQKIGAAVYNVSFPRCKQYKGIWNYEYLRCFLQNAGFAGMHVCCTCAMGNTTSSVVDERLRVRGGVKGVRVADASVMPKITSGNTHAAIMMIGAKAADMIIADAKAAKAAEKKNNGANNVHIIQ